MIILEFGINLSRNAADARQQFRTKIG